MIGVSFPRPEEHQENSQIDEVPSMRTRSAIAIVASCAALSAWSMGRVAAQSQGVPGGTLSEVATEIRLLREALQAGQKTQTLASVMAVQQSRITPITAELSNLRREIDEQTVALQKSKEGLRTYQALPKVDKAVAESMMASIQGAESRLALLNGRERDLSARLQNEEAAWAQLMAQLQEAIRR